MKLSFAPQIMRSSNGLNRLSGHASRFGPFVFAAACLLASSNAKAQNKLEPRIVVPAGLTKTDIADGWLALFDGTSLVGWRSENTSVNWRVLDGEIRADQGATGLLRTTTEFDDYELKVDFWASTETDSGVFLRTSPAPKDMTRDAYELNVANATKHLFPTGSLVGRKKVGVECLNDQWRTFYVKVEGNSVLVKLDGETINQYTAPSGPRRGFIGLQHDAGPIRFRNIALRPLNVESIFNGKDLSQWDASQANSSRFSVTDAGAIKVVNGRGQLESRMQFANFVFSIKCKTNSAGLNSGVFFRSIPGQFTNGYESQIQNQFKNNDRSQPVDCGTGGIFRRVDARHVNAEDKLWFNKTIIANGPHISVWVNGLQVTDWTDRRKPHANPRKGFRKEAGTFILQGHDPTTDVLFRDIKARELSKRR